MRVGSGVAGSAVTAFFVGAFRTATGAGTARMSTTFLHQRVSTATRDGERERGEEDCNRSHRHLQVFAEDIHCHRHNNREENRSDAGNYAEEDRDTAEKLNERHKVRPEWSETGLTEKSNGSREVGNFHPAGENKNKADTDTEHQESRAFVVPRATLFHHHRNSIT